MGHGVLRGEGLWGLKAVRHAEDRGGEWTQALRFLSLPSHPSRLLLPADPAAALPAAALPCLLLPPSRPCPREEQTGEHLQRNETTNVTVFEKTGEEERGRGKSWLVS